jgi:hypothetical protein
LDTDTKLYDSFFAESVTAMIAYARMQFTEMTDYESKELQNALLKYCELDTLAMVMLTASLKNRNPAKKNK